MFINRLKHLIYGDKGWPYDNAVAEATFKVIKVEFVHNRVVGSLDELLRELADYVHWFNTKCILWCSKLYDT